MKKIFPVHPANPERICWGCDKYCAAKDMMCGNGSDRTQHPFELFGENWRDWGSDYAPDPAPVASALLNPTPIRCASKAANPGAPPPHAP